MERIRDNTINFEKVITKEDLMELPIEEVELAKKESAFHAKYLRASFSDGKLIELLSNRSRELAFLGRKYHDKSDTFKELLAANIVFPNDESFIKTLLCKNIGFYQLYSYARAVSSVKKITAMAKELENDEIKIISRKINRLCAIIKNYYNIKDYNLILAKIAEIIVFKKDLYQKLEDEQLNLEKIKKH